MIFERKKKIEDSILGEIFEHGYQICLPFWNIWDFSFIVCSLRSRFLFIFRRKINVGCLMTHLICTADRRLLIGNLKMAKMMNKKKVGAPCSRCQSIEFNMNVYLFSSFPSFESKNIMKKKHRALTQFICLPLQKCFFKFICQKVEEQKVLLLLLCTYFTYVHTYSYKRHLHPSIAPKEIYLFKNRKRRNFI